MRSLAPLLVLTVGCGRLGFESSRAGAGDDVSGGDASITADAYTPPTCAPACGVSRHCATPLGMCGAQGMCMVTPTLCDGGPAPVCGCDGQTYDTECLAEAAGISVATVGACPSSSYVPNCSPVCGAGTYCSTTVGACGTAGTCKPIPAPGSLSCVDLPVCGCDLQNYSNACVAEEAGMSLSVTGPCSST